MRSRMSRTIIRALFAAALLGVLAPMASAGDNPAIEPVPRDGWWMERHEEKLKTKADMENVDLLMIGDSITHGWEGRGKATWDKYYADRNALNIGYSGDRTEHVLWRFEHGEIDGIAPKLAVIMIGTNNIGHGSSTPAQTVIGVEKVIAELRKKLPETKVLLLAVFPRDAKPGDAKRAMVDEINEGLPALADGKMVHFLDINDVFLTDDGELPKSIMPDLLHPNEEGYGLWAEAVEPSIAKLMGDKCKLAKPKLALQLYAVRGQFKQDVAATLAEAAKMGYKGVEFWGYGGQPTIEGLTGEQLRALLDENGLECCGIHCARKALEDANFAATVEMNKKLGNDFLIIAASQPDMASPETVKAFAEFLNAKAKEAAKDGMRVGYHAHGFDFAEFDGVTAWDLLFSQTDPEVIMQLDVGNSAGGGGKPVEILEKFPGRCASLHIKEHPGGPLGEGDQDWDRVFELCDELHQPEWYVVEQGDEGGNGYVLPKQAIDQLKAWGK